MRTFIQIVCILAAMVLFLPQNVSAADTGEPFQPGTWTGQIFGHVMNDVSGHSDMSYALSLGAGRFVLPGFSLNLETSAWIVTQDGPDATGFGLTLVPRWHFYRTRDWSVFIDGGLGVIWTNEDVPPGSKKHNFTEFAGLGFTRRICESLRLMAGARYRHVSNNHSSDNPGLDNIEGFLGLMLPF